MAESKASGAAVDAETVTCRLATIGVPLGFALDPQTGRERGVVRHGTDFLNVDVDVYRLLYRATSTVRREALIEWASAHQHIADPEHVVDRCLEAGLLREIDFGAERIEMPWPELRLQAIGVGMGPDENDRCRIDVPRREPAAVDRFTYTAWAASDGRSLRKVADALAADLEQPSDVTETLLTLSVLRLLTQGAAFLDLAP